MGWFSFRGGGLLQKVKSGDLGAVTAALAGGVSPDARDKDRKSALMWAAERGQMEMVRALLDAGADPHSFDSAGDSALVHAAAAGHFAVVRELIGRGANPNARNANGETAAVAMLDHPNFTPQSVHETIIRDMVAAGLDVNLADKKGLVPLIAAIQFGSIELVRALLEGGADPNASQLDVSALILAAWFGQGAIVEALLEAGAAHSRPNGEGITPLNMAVGAYRDELARDNELAGWAGADLESRLRAVRALLAAGADSNRRDPAGNTPVMAAAHMDRDQIIRSLASAGADLDAIDDVRMELVQRGPIFESRERVERRGITALMFAAGQGRTMAAVTLIELGANPDLKDSEGLTALELARETNPDTAAAMAKALAARR